MKYTTKISYKMQLWYLYKKQNMRYFLESLKIFKISIGVHSCYELLSALKFIDIKDFISKSSISDHKSHRQFNQFSS